MRSRPARHLEDVVQDLLRHGSGRKLLTALKDRRKKTRSAAVLASVTGYSFEGEVRARVYTRRRSGPGRFAAPGPVFNIGLRGTRRKGQDVEKVIISAAITGGMTVPGQSPAIPITPEEIVDSAVGAHEAGAAIVHIHVREPETGKPCSSLELFRDVVSGIKERCDVIVQPTTGGGKGMTLEERPPCCRSSGPRWRPSTQAASTSASSPSPSAAGTSKTGR